MTSTGVNMSVTAGEEPKCPMCGGELGHDEVDIGVGMQYGPTFCFDCGWCEDPGDEFLLDEEFDE